MKNLWVFGALLAALLVFSSNAMALSTEQATVNSDGSAKYTDPDEKTPFGVSGSNTPSNGSRLNGPFTEPSVNGPSVQQMMGVNQGNAAFNQAYGHVTNQNR